MIIANSALRASLAIYHLISNARSWNNCWCYQQVICSPSRDSGADVSSDEGLTLETSVLESIYGGQIILPALLKKAKH